ncbi:MAG TPA: DNA adenine methylase [Capsulimonadaceae bacterium]|jgi:adenine-specific DNA-methyltransferase
MRVIAFALAAISGRRVAPILMSTPTITARNLVTFSVPFTYNASRHAYSRTDDYLFAQLIPYIGSKRKLLPLIGRAITGVLAVQSANPPEMTFADLFAGSGVVGRAAKQMGFRVVANDWEPYAEAINGAFIGLNAAPICTTVFDELNSLPPCDGFVTQNYCPRDDSDCDPAKERMFYTRANGMRIDAIRTQIEEWELSGELTRDQKYFLLAPLLSAASYVSNTSGVFKAYHAGWGGQTRTAHYRILSDLRVSAPPLCDNGRDNVVTRLDALAAARQLSESFCGGCDIAYLDPPYNQHPYGSNYHMLNTIALYDRPEVPGMVHGGKSAIRTDWRTERRSAFNTASMALPALEEIVDALPCRWVLMSYSTDGNIPVEALVASLSQRGAVRVETRRYKRYRVSAQRMSQKSHNVEFVLVLDKQGKHRTVDQLECLEAIAAAASD